MRKLVEKGVLTNLNQYGGEILDKKVNYISSHRYKYPGIDDWDAISQHEKELTQAEQRYFPLKDLDKYQELAQNGDIITLTTTKSGLLVSHVGFITFGEQGELLFTHASSRHDKVVYEVNLRDYLDTRTTITGIMAYRPNYTG
jgi:hypothetical protein